MDTDACKNQIGAALFQVGDDGKRHPVEFWSRSLTPAERKYSASEREFLAVIWAVQILRPYLEGRHSTVFTDHNALRCLSDQADASLRLARWRLRLLEFDFEVWYSKGVENTVTDAISKLPTFGHTNIDPDLEIPCLLTSFNNAIDLAATIEPSSGNIVTKIDDLSWTEDEWDPEEWQQNDEKTISRYENWCNVNEMHSNCGILSGEAVSAEPRIGSAPNRKPISTITIDELFGAQLNDPECQEAREQIDERSKTPYFIDERGLIVRVALIDETVQILVPARLRPRALYLHHYTPVAGHLGVTRQYYTMRNNLYWPKMAEKIRQTSQNCHHCAKERIKLRNKSNPLKLFPAARTLEFVAIDLLGSLEPAYDGSKHICVISDRYSKLTRAIPMKRISALEVARVFLNNCVFVYGLPHALLSDNRPQFAASLFESVCASLSIGHAFTSTYHPQTNGQVERFNRTLLAGLRMFPMNNVKTWPEHVGALTYSYNTTVHPSLGLTPFQLVLTEPPKGRILIRKEPKYDMRGKLPKGYHRRIISQFREMYESATTILKAA